MSFSDADEDFITYGTPFEPLEEDEVPKKKPCLIEDQIVTDKQGRRRFHGAFTGGFSAGFFNTVGSLEGWKPSSFKSSKCDKQKIMKQRPEDFMDEEDFSEFGIAPFVLKARKDYTSENHTSNRFLEYLNLGKYVLKDLLKPARETIGIKLLRKMGWKPGFGVGPRISFNEKKKKRKTYQCKSPSELQVTSNSSNSDSDAEPISKKLSPFDCEPKWFQPKHNFYGIGYEGLDKRPVLGSSNSKNKVSEEESKIMRGETVAFGVGAFEEEDENIFSRDDMSRYDFSLEIEQESASTVNLSQKTICFLDGFAVQTEKYTKKVYPKPLLPKNFKGRRKPIASLDCDRKKLSRWDKGVKEATKTVSEGATFSHDDKVAVEKLISDIPIDTEKFKPFLNDFEKQERYEKYLKLSKIGRVECFRKLQPETMREWDKEKEIIEFEKAAALFKPLTGQMGDRFATAQEPDDVSDPLATVKKFTNENNELEKAAKMNFFGSMSRKTQIWAPSSLLCKRFNIPDPKTCCSASEQKQKYSLFDCQDENYYSKIKFDQSNIGSTFRASSEQGLSTEEEKSIVDKVRSEENNLNLPINKPDLFKVIFLASDEENDESITQDTKIYFSNQQDKGLLFEEKVINSKRNGSPPKGIFENVDLELLAMRKRPKEVSQVIKYETKISENHWNEESNPFSSNLVYGPKIPENFTVLTDGVRCDDSQNDEIWVEKKISRKKKKKKEKKKKKAHRSKHKHKRKS